MPSVLSALKETEQALALYRAALDNRQSLGDAQDQLHAAFDMAHDQFLAGSLSNLDLLTSEQSLVAVDAAVASSDAGLVQDQIAVFKALGGGWRGEGKDARWSANSQARLSVAIGLFVVMVSTCLGAEACARRGVGAADRAGAAQRWKDGESHGLA